jgi:hypothetical protein
MLMNHSGQRSAGGGFLFYVALLPRFFASGERNCNWLDQSAASVELHPLLMRMRAIGHTRQLIHQKA